MGHESHELPLVTSLDCPTPTLRRELLFRLQTFGGKPCYVVEDPVSARFFRIGLAEYALVSRLDGRRTIGEALEDIRHLRTECEFTPTDALAICQWVLRSGLAQSDAAGNTASIASMQGPRRRGGRIGPLSLQIPLCHPDRFFQRLEPWLAWCFSFPAFLVWLGVIGWAFCDLIAHYDRLIDSSSHVLAAGNWIWLGLAWVLLKIIHECGHAIACRRFGGDVREAGVIFILLAPLAYVDVTSSWRLHSKWARIAVASAGMYVELFLAAVATIAWAHLTPGPTSQICLNVMTTAGVMTVLFNANPLMRFDGYYILSDLVELPNLYTIGQQYIQQLVRRWYFGLPGLPLPYGGVRGIFIRCFAIASLIWRNLVFFGLVLSAATLLQGAGIVLSAMALVLWITSMLRRFIAFVRNHHGPRPHWGRFAVSASATAAVVLFCLLAIPWPGAITAPALVRYAPEVVVRTECDGFVCDVCVRGGDPVQAGQVLVKMSNDQLEHDLTQLEISIRQSELKRRIQQRQGELAKSQAESEELRTLQKQYEEKRSELERLVVRAPCSGEVIGRSLDSLRGRFLTKGSHLLSIGSEQAKEIRISIAQQDIAPFREHLGQPARVYLPDQNVLVTTLSKVEPRASSIPLDHSLCAPHGGVLTVRTASRSPGATTGTEYELLSPRFNGILALDSAQSQHVRAGQRAYVALKPYETIGTHLYHLANDWIDRKLHRKSHQRLSQRGHGGSEQDLPRNDVCSFSSL